MLAYLSPGVLPRNLLPLGCGLAGLLLNVFLAFANSSSWNVDFNQFYSAGKLAGSGRLYDWDSIRALETEQKIKAVPFGRIPVFALAFKPLSSLPWPVARGLWLGVGVAALAGFLLLWPFPRREWACVGICWSAPVAMGLALGQDSILFLFFVALGLRMLMRRYDFRAGLAFSACIAKPHLALLIPVFLIGRLNWRALLGGAAGVAASIGLSFAVEGKEWLAQLLVFARNPEFDPAGGRMPNLRGLLTLAGGSFWMEIAIGGAVIAAVWFLSRTQSLPVIGTIVLAAGLLLSHHAYFYDAVLVLPALFLPFETLHFRRMRSWALFLLTPAPYMLLLTRAVRWDILLSRDTPWLLLPR